MNAVKERGIHLQFDACPFTEILDQPKVDVSNAVLLCLSFAHYLHLHTSTI